MSWLQQHLKAAENILNNVDSVVSRTVAPQQHAADPTQAASDHTPAQGSVSDGQGFTYTTRSPFGSSSPPSSHAQPSQPHPASEASTTPMQPETPGSTSDSTALPAQTSVPHTDTPSTPSSASATAIPSVPGSTTPNKGVSSSGASSTTPPPVLPASMSVTAKRADTGSLPAVPMAEGGTAASSREQQLLKVIEQYKERLRTSKVEAEQLEDLLAQAEARCERERALISQLQGEVGALAESKSLMEGALSQQLSAQAASLQEAQQRADALARQVSSLEAQLAAATESSRTMLQNKTDIEGGMLEALRAQLSSVEAQLDTERRAHAATRTAAIARESELEASQGHTSLALAELQRQLEQGAQRVQELESALMLATARHQELEQTLKHREKQGSATQLSDSASQDASQELHDLRAELEKQHEACQRAVAACMAAQTETKTLRDELDHLRAASEQDLWKKNVAALEASLREAHDLLYTKQATIERLSADRAALQLRLEREMHTTSRHRAEAEHHALTMTDDNKSASSNAGDSSVVPTTSVLGERYRRLASRPDNLGTALAAATALVDKTASITAHVLRQYPLVRIAAGAYLLLLHLYVYVLTWRMQAAAVVMEEQGSAGVAKPH